MAFLFRARRQRESEEELASPYHLLLVQPNPTDSTRASVNVVYIARNLSHVLDIDIEESHRLCIEVTQLGVAVVGTFTKRECIVHEGKLQQLEIMCRSIPAPVVEDGGIIMGGNNDAKEKSSAVATSAKRLPDIYDAYANRMESAAWANDYTFESHAASLEDICMIEFCRKYRLSKAGSGDVGKIKLHDKPKSEAPRFSPSFSSGKNGPDYGKYCRFSLVKYRPWVGSPFGTENGAEEPSEDECIQQWETFVIKLRETKHSIPDVLLPPELKEECSDVEERNEDNSKEEMGQEKDTAQQQIGMEPQQVESSPEDVISPTTQYSFNIADMSYLYTQPEEASTIDARTDDKAEATIGRCPTKSLGLPAAAEKAMNSVEEECDDPGNDNDEARDDLNCDDGDSPHFQQTRSTGSTNARTPGSQSTLFEI